MKKRSVLISSCFLFLLGCSILADWKAIHPPEGCNQCHYVPIGNNWRVMVSPVTLNDELDRTPWQEPASVLSGESPAEQEKKISEQRCFRCHKGPDKAHVLRKGRFHHSVP